jgi:hypothetical protein
MGLVFLHEMGYGVHVGSKMEILGKRRKRTLIVPGVIGFEIAQLPGQGDGPTSIPLMKVLDQNLHFGECPVNNSLEIAKAQGLETNIGIVEILNRRLDEKYFHAMHSLANGVVVNRR